MGKKKTKQNFNKNYEEDRQSKKTRAEKASRKRPPTTRELEGELWNDVLEDLKELDAIIGLD